MESSNFLSQLFGFLPMHLQWLIFTSIAVVLTYAASFITNRLKLFWVKRLKEPWKKILVQAIHLPIKILIWIWGLSFCFEIAINAFSIHPEGQYLTKLRSLTFVSIFAWAALRMVSHIEEMLNESFSKKHRVDKTSLKGIGNLARVIVLLISSLVLLQLLGIPLSGVIAFGGVGGIAIGFAAKDLLANFFGGLVIFIDRPFSIGDWILSPDKEIEGVVEHVGWRQVRIRTFETRPLYIPNSVFLNVSIENVSRMHNRRIKTMIGVRYDDATHMDKIVDDIKKMLIAHPGIDSNKTMVVNFTNFGAHSLDILLYTFTKTTGYVEYHRMRQDVFLKIIDIINKHGGECAFPTRTLHIQSADAIDKESLNLSLN